MTTLNWIRVSLITEVACFHHFTYIITKVHPGWFNIMVVDPMVYEEGSLMLDKQLGLGHAKSLAVKHAEENQ